MIKGQLGDIGVLGPTGNGLDPADWRGLRDQAYRMLEDALDHIQGLSEGPVWRPASPEARSRFQEPLPRAPTDLADSHARFKQDILPHGGGNAHPGFMAWVQGAGTPVGMLAEMLAGALNANLGGRDHMPIAVEQQVLGWVREMFRFPSTASGLFLTGASQANFVAVLIARTRALGARVRSDGLAFEGRALTAYASRAAHGCVPRALDMAGLGADALRRIDIDDQHRIDLRALRKTIAQDRAEGRRPFLIVGSAGTVDVGAIDDLATLADLARDEGLWFHIDGALGALGVLSPVLAPRLAGIERCDSLAFDFHKWGQVPYDAGFLLVRDAAAHRATFAAEAGYLSRSERGMAAGDWWPCDDGPDLSRGFRALKTWFTLRTYGADALGEVMAGCCDLAGELALRVAAEPELNLLAPVALNIVCFSYGDGGQNRRIVEDLQIAGVVAPSMTLLDGRPAIRAAIVNHRTRLSDIDALIQGVLRFGRAAAKGPNP